MTNPIPKDFCKHAQTENDRELQDRFGQSPKVIKRWRRDCQISSPAKKTKATLPDDFREHLHLTTRALATRYDVGEKVIRRFRKEIESQEP